MAIIIYGILQPLLVRRLEDDLYEILTGERRWHAAKIAGLSKVPVVIKNVNNETAFAFEIMKNWLGKVKSQKAGSDE